MSTISPAQYSLILNVFSLMAAALLLTAVFFLLQRTEVHGRYRSVLLLNGLICLMASYSYFRLYGSWVGTFRVTDAALVRTGQPFEDGYRYADWLVTVPLLLVAMVQILDLPAMKARLRSVVLAFLAAEMVGVGYVGQLAGSTQTRLIWWGIAMIPFAVILYQLFVSLAEAVAHQPIQVRPLVGAARFVLVASWSIYPAFFVFPVLGMTGSDAFTGTQLVIAAADLVSKAAFGVLLFWIADRKSTLATLRDAEDEGGARGR